MCGFAGEVRFDGAPARPQVVQRMLAPLAPRGPDGHGMLTRGSFALGHHRLAVMDRSEASAQPLTHEAAGLTVVYNGALYDYRALRDELASTGHRFETDGDTEVLLAAYRAWGPDCVQRLRGQFACAVLEHDSGRVWLARDRMGIKPLYWAAGPGWLRFASTLPALVAGGDIDTALDPIALQHYLTLHTIVMPPRTILAGVRKLAPASAMLVDRDGTREASTYWTLRRRPDPSLEDWPERVGEALRRAVQRRLVADREVGVLLSGGLDSSLIVALLAELGHTRRTFSIGFSAEAGESGDEFPWSDWVAQSFGTEHVRISVDPGETLQCLPRAIEAMSEPMASHDCVGFWRLAQCVSERLAVVQCGQGADELFAGYHWYPPLLHASDPVTEYRRLFFDRDYAGYLDTVHDELGTPDHVSGAIAGRLHDAPSPADAALQVDASTMLPGDPLPRVDNMAMAHGVEARLPFLDEDVVELALQIPASRTMGKEVLKAVAARRLPATLVRRPKAYFPVPALRWLRGDLLAQIRAWVESATRHGIFRRSAMTQLLAAPDRHLTPLGGSMLWQLATLEAWLQTHVRPASG